MKEEVMLNSNYSITSSFVSKDLIRLYREIASINSSNTAERL